MLSNDVNKNTSREVTSGDKGAENYLDSGHLLLLFLTLSKVSFSEFLRNDY